MIEKEKVENLEKIKTRIEKTTDKAGKLIDPEILDVIISLNLHDFETYHSCGGHTKHENTGKVEGPWVSIEQRKTYELFLESGKIYKEVEDKKAPFTKLVVEKINKMNGITDKIRNNIGREMMRLILLLDEFYRVRTADYDTRLIIESKAFFVDIKNQGYYSLQFLPKGEQKTRLTIYQKEFTDFGKFLINSYLKK